MDQICNIKSVNTFTMYSLRRNVPLLSLILFFNSHTSRKLLAKIHRLQNSCTASFHDVWLKPWNSDFEIKVILPPYQWQKDEGPKIPLMRNKKIPDRYGHQLVWEKHQCLCKTVLKHDTTHTPTHLKDKIDPRHHAWLTTLFLRDNTQRHKD